MPYRKYAEAFGHKIIRLFEGLGRVSGLGFEVIKDIFRGKINLELVYEQMVKIGIESIPLALITALFVGMVFAIQIAGEFVKFGAGNYVGGVMGIGIARELGPAITGIVIAARVAASITAEIGTMQVKEQIDALRALGANPIRYLIIPRFISAIFMLPLLTIFADIVGLFGGYIVAIYLGTINPAEYMETAQNLLEMWDIVGGLIKTAIFGLLIALIACYKGMRTKGGARGVGEATTSSVVTSLITLFIVNYFLSVLFFK